MLSIAFLGAGNMAQAIMGGLTESKGDYRIIAFDPAEPCRQAAAALGASIADSNEAAVADADVILLCVKPNVTLSLADEISGKVDSRLVVSVAAGITTASLAAHLGKGVHIVRCMPNTPALVQTGMSALFAAGGVTSEEKASAGAVMGAVGQTLWVDNEEDLDAVTAVSGSGPAYFFFLMESMITAAMREGLSKSVAEKLVLQTALGAARLALGSEHDPGTLRKQVSSPGGTTEAAIETFMDRKLPDIVAAAVRAARNRSVELSGDH